jgi:hypothetical protein
MVGGGRLFAAEVTGSKGSLIRIKTTAQSKGKRAAISFAGATIDVVLFDEPPDSIRLLTEAVMRLEERGGILLISMTPINVSAETLAHIRGMCDRGIIKDHWAELTPAELIPVGSSRPVRTADGRPKDAAWIAERYTKCDEYEAPIVVHGRWDGGQVDRYFSRFTVETHVTSQRQTPKDDRPYIVVLGIDHGNRPGKQVAILMIVDESVPDSPVFHVIDEYEDSTGIAEPKDDARAILSVLARHGLVWSDLDYAHGDRAHLPGSEDQKSNRDLMLQIRRQTAPDPKISTTLRPQIETVKRGEGRAQSRSTGERYLYHAVSHGRFFVDPRCKRVIAAIVGYSGLDDEHKDPIDAIRYAIDPWIFRERHRRPGSAVRFGAI